VVTVRIWLDGGGCLRRVSAEGHSLAGPVGADVPCAAVSVLVRTTARLVAMETRIASSGSSDGRGSLDLEVKEYPENLGEWLRGATDYLIRGVTDVSGEFPDHVSIEMQEWRKRYGT
jgi:uncharacterized protein